MFSIYQLFLAPRLHKVKATDLIIDGLGLVSEVEHFLFVGLGVGVFIVSKQPFAPFFFDIIIKEKLQFIIIDINYKTHM